MNKKMIRAIISIPENFNNLKNKESVYSLLKNTGYFDCYDLIHEREIIEELKLNPNKISLWLQWSEDKRSDCGWYIKQTRDGNYIVDYYPIENNMSKVELTDKTKACAIFIKKEIEDIRKN